MLHNVTWLAAAIKCYANEAASLCKFLHHVQTSLVRCDTGVWHVTEVWQVTRVWPVTQVWQVTHVWPVTQVCECCVNCQRCCRQWRWVCAVYKARLRSRLWRSVSVIGVIGVINVNVSVTGEVTRLSRLLRHICWLNHHSHSLRSLHPALSLSVRLSVCLSVCLSVRLSVCPSVCLSVILWNEGGGLRLVQCELVTVIVGLTRVCCSVNGKVHRKIVTCLCMCGSVSMYRHCIYVCMLLTVVVRCCLLIFVRWSTQSQLVTLFTDGRSTAARHYTCM